MFSMIEIVTVKSMWITLEKRKNVNYSKESEHLNQWYNSYVVYKSSNTIELVLTCPNWGEKTHVDWSSSRIRDAKVTWPNALPSQVFKCINIEQ